MRRIVLLLSAIGVCLVAAWLIADFDKSRYDYVPGSPYAEPQREASQ